MFKGTPNYNREKGNGVDQFLERVGANYNATTWVDRTNYYADRSAASTSRATSPLRPTACATSGYASRTGSPR